MHNSTVVFAVLMVMFQLKHWIVDFILQTESMVKGKGIYGNPSGIYHSYQHGMATFIILMYTGAMYHWIVFLIIGCIDFITHYHIDWVKMKFGNRDISQSKFWVQLGLDQMLHQLVYIGLAYYVSAHFLLDK